MSLPTGRQDLVGNLVLAGSAELGMPVGSTIATGASLTSNEFQVPCGASVQYLCDLTSGTATVEIFTYSVTATPGSADDSVTVLTGLPTYVMADTSETNKYVQVKITNNSGSNMILEKSAVQVLGLLEAKEQFAGRGNALVYAVASDHNGNGTGAYVLTNNS